MMMKLNLGTRFKDYLCDNCVKLETFVSMLMVNTYKMDTLHYERCHMVHASAHLHIYSLVGGGKLPYKKDGACHTLYSGSKSRFGTSQGVQPQKAHNSSFRGTF